MKKLELKEVTTQVDDGNGNIVDIPVLYKDLIQGALNYMPTGQMGQPIGIPVDEMRQRIRVLDKIDTDEKEVMVDDEDVIVIFNCVKMQKFIKVDKTLVDYHDYIEKLFKSKGE